MENRRTVGYDSLELDPFAEEFFVIVDDDLHILNSLARVLDAEKISYKVFQDPLEAMNFISKNRISHVFSDYHMNEFGMSGKWIKEICKQYNINCSLVSSDESVADIDKMAFMTDCISYMKKVI